MNLIDRGCKIVESQGKSLNVLTAPPVRPDAVEFSVPATVGLRVREVALSGALGLLTVMSVFPPSHETTYTWFFVPFFASGSLHFLVRAFDRRARLTVDADGIVERTALIGGPLRIEWQEIVGVSSSHLSDTVELAVRDLAEIKKRAGPSRRFWMLLRRLVGKRTIPVSPALLGLDGEELEARLEMALYRFEHAQVVQGRENLLRVEPEKDDS